MARGSAVNLRHDRLAAADETNGANLRSVNHKSADSDLRSARSRSSATYRQIVTGLLRHDGRPPFLNENRPRVKRPNACRPVDSLPASDHRSTTFDAFQNLGFQTDPNSSTGDRNLKSADPCVQTPAIAIMNNSGVSLCQFHVEPNFSTTKFVQPEPGGH